MPAPRSALTPHSSSSDACWRGNEDGTSARQLRRAVRAAHARPTAAPAAQDLLARARVCFRRASAHASRGRRQRDCSCRQHKACRLGAHQRRARQQRHRGEDGDQAGARATARHDAQVTKEVPGRRAEARNSGCWANQALHARRLLASSHVVEGHDRCGGRAGVGCRCDCVNSAARRCHVVASGPAQTVRLRCSEASTGCASIDLPPPRAGSF